MIFKENEIILTQKVKSRLKRNCTYEIKDYIYRKIIYITIEQVIVLVLPVVEINDSLLQVGVNSPLCHLLLFTCNSRSFLFN